jgi:hypothetical protein
MGVMNKTMSFISQTLIYKGHAGHRTWIWYPSSGTGVFAFLPPHIFNIIRAGFGSPPSNSSAIVYHHPHVSSQYFGASSSRPGSHAGRYGGVGAASAVF